MSAGDPTSDVRAVAFSSDVHPDLPVEVIEYSTLVERVGPGLFDIAERPSFGLLVVVRGGSGSHTVDFETIRLTAGRVVLVLPGQVHAWHESNDLDAAAVVVRGGLPSIRNLVPGRHPFCDLGAGSMKTALDVVDALGREQVRFSPDSVAVDLVAAMFDVLVGLFRRAAVESSGSALPDAYVAFRAAVELDLRSSHTVRDVVADLGYSERTVNRACKTAVGLSAKGVLDERLALEAKRLLVHTDRPIAAVGSALGFGEASNFNKFFIRLTGELPSEFRRGMRTSGYRATDTS